MNNIVNEINTETLLDKCRIDEGDGISVTPLQNIIVTKFMIYIENINNTKITLLRNLEVVQWIMGDLSFLPEIEKQNKTADRIKLKVLEDNWGRAIMKIRRPDLLLNKQWTNKFGEYICEELYILKGKEVSRPTKIGNLLPDLITEDVVIEAKAGTYKTSGTAYEKILGCVYKYSDVPELFKKPLIIVCIGGAEEACRNQYGNLEGEKCTITKKEQLENYKMKYQIEFVGASDIIKSFLVI